MKIALIYPTKLDNTGKPIKYRRAFLPSLSLAILNSLTPRNHEVIVVNDLVEEIDFSDSYDLVAITAMTSQVKRVYQIADHFRKLKVKVIIGGVHAFFLPDEVKKHCDSIVIGESENLWEQILIDAEKNKLKEIYKDSSLPNLERLIIPRWDNINLKIYPKPLGYKFPLMPIYTTRGCPYGCKFCSVTKYFGKKYRVKPIENVLKEIDTIGAESYFFVDDNIACEPDYSRELFKALSKRNIRWFSQISTTILKHPDIIDLAGKSGCFGLFLGIETINKNNLEYINKTFNKIEKYEELLARIRQAGIFPFPSVMFGFDDDTPESIKQTCDFLMKNKVGHASFTLLTPLPGTDLYDELKKDGRILYDDWTKYDLNTIIFKPLNFSEKELYDSFWKSFGDFYSIKNIFKRIYYNNQIVKKKKVAQFLEDLFYQFFFKKAISSFEHPFSGGILRKN